MYPPRSRNWYTIMQVVQTVEVPPNHGRIYFPMIGWIWKSRNELRKMVMEKYQYFAKEMPECPDSLITVLKTPL
jgi:hypothetical protein